MRARILVFTVILSLPQAVAACSGDDASGGSGTGGITTDANFLLPDAPNSGGSAQSGAGGVGGNSGDGGGAGGSTGGVGGNSGDGGGAGGSTGGGTSDAATDSESEAGGAAGNDASTDAPTDSLSDSSGDGSVVDASDGGVDSSAEGGICQPSAWRCNGDVLEQCAGDGSAYKSVENCKPGACFATGAQCLQCANPGQCPAAPECSQATCAFGTCGTVPKSAGASCPGGFCNGAGKCGTCIPGTTRCTGGTEDVCNAAGNWQTSKVCPFICSGGSCTGVCVPGSKGCSGSTTQLCDSAAKWTNVQSCTGTTPICLEGYCQPQLTSCSGLANNCGPNGTSSCCSTRQVAAQSFKRSYDGVLYTNASYDAQIGACWVDTYEVTVGRFRKFVDAGRGTSASAPASGDGAHPKVTGSGWQASWNSNLSLSTAALKSALACNALATWTATPGANETRPINCVTWYDAFAFCAWDGGRLPTEAEWNLTASGGSEQRVHPWSSPPTSTALSPTHASYWVDATNTCMGDGVPGCTVADLIFVGSKPAGAGRWGHSDLAGNVAEWVLDAFKNPYEHVPCNDCASLSGAPTVLRGGSFFGQSALLPGASRAFGDASTRFFSVGLRCARDL